MRRKKNKKKWMRWGTVMVLLIGFAVIALWSGVCVRRYVVHSEHITDSVRLAVISDLHSTVFGENQSNLLKKISEEAPDAILLTGDIVDDRVAEDGAWMLIEQISGKWPCFYVTGNHELWTERPEEICDIFRAYGVTVLQGDTVELELQGQRISISGVDDRGIGSSNWKKQLQRCEAARNDDVFSILLSHRPEQVETYEQFGFDLILSGHAHGGQVRIPGLLNGLYAPNQGWFPDYAGGLYVLEDTTLVVSRGLALNSIPRVFNPPELVIIELEP